MKTQLTITHAIIDIVINAITIITIIQKSNSDNNDYYRNNANYSNNNSECVTIVNVFDTLCYSKFCFTQCEKNGHFHMTNYI